jgi:hypothetical protein
MDGWNSELDAMRCERGRGRRRGAFHSYVVIHAQLSLPSHLQGTPFVANV